MTKSVEKFLEMWS